MRITITFKHLEHTPALDERIKEKSEKLAKYFQGKLNVDWVCWVHGEEHWAELKVHGTKFDFFAKACDDNMYKALDLVVEKMERQVDKKKQKATDKIHVDHKEHPKYKAILSTP